MALPRCSKAPGASNKFGDEARAAFAKVVERILHNFSRLMERSFASVQELNRYRQELLRALTPPDAPTAT